MTRLRLTFVLKHDGDDKLYWLYMYRMRKNFIKVYRYAQKVANGEEQMQQEQRD